MKRTVLRGVRKWTQIFFFVLIALISVNKTLSEAGYEMKFVSDASLHALCPFGGVVTLYHLAVMESLIQKIHMSAVILMGLIFLLTVLFGPVFCGWVCPLGTAQEWVGILGRKLIGKKYNSLIPKRVDRLLRYLRYGVLIWVVFVTARSGQLLFEKVDPYNALFTFWSEEAALPALVILSAVLGTALLVERPWCKYLCPYGALLGIFNRVRIFKIVRRKETCISCSKCDRSCPMNIMVSNKSVVVDSQCISCLQCTSENSCPVEKTVEMRRGESAHRGVNTAVTAAITFVLIFGGIAVTAATELWTTSRDRNTNAGVSAESNPVISTDDLRGSFTFQEAADSFGIDLDVLLNAFSISESDGGGQMKVKDLKLKYAESEEEIGRESVQFFVALYQGDPSVPEGIYLPESAVDILLNGERNLTDDQKKYLKGHMLKNE